MLKNGMIILSCLFLLVSTLALGQNRKKGIVAAAKPAPAPEADWTVLVYMNADNNLEEFAIQNFLDMAKVGSSARVNIIVQMDRIDKYDFRYGDWSNTRRFRITRKLTPEDKPLEDLGEVDMGKEESLTDFINWGIAKFPSKKRLLVIWDHGQGYRLYNTLAKTGAALHDGIESEKLKPISSRNLFAKKADNEKVVRYDRSTNKSPYRSCSNDETSNSELYNREIQDVLERIVKKSKHKFDVIGFDCCLMSMIETAFAFRNAALYMVGSEDLEPGAGWRYDDWLSKLLSNPGMDGAQLGKLLVSSYQKTYQFPDRTTTLSAIDLSKMDAVSAAISSFSDNLRQLVKSDHPIIRSARMDCAHYAPNESVPNPFYHIDFIRFCDRIAMSKANQLIRDQAVSVKNLVKSIVIANYAGELRRGKFGSFGLAIYFPPSLKAYENDYYEEGGYKKGNKNYPVEFVEKHKWSDFLHEYFKKVTG